MLSFIAAAMAVGVAAANVQGEAFHGHGRFEVCSDYTPSAFLQMSADAVKEWCRCLSQNTAAVPSCKQSRSLHVLGTRCKTYILSCLTSTSAPQENVRLYGAVDTARLYALDRWSSATLQMLHSVLVLQSAQVLLLL
jgi:hypothetical protein